jgi:transcriptional regulator with XRE-family HTH domain
MTITEQKALKALREEQKLSLREMAKKCGVDKATLSKLERGIVNNLREETERKIATGYGIITRVIRRDLCENACEGIDSDTLKGGKIREYRNAELIWETTMMDLVGEDGPRSVAQAINKLKKNRSELLEALKAIVDEVDDYEMDSELERKLQAAREAIGKGGPHGQKKND